MGSSWWNHEVKLAYALGKPIVPVFQEEFEPPLESKREPHVEAVLRMQGVSFLDKSNVDVDASMGLLDRSIRDLAAGLKNRKE